MNESTNERTTLVCVEVRWENYGANAGVFRSCWGTHMTPIEVALATEAARTFGRVEMRGTYREYSMTPMYHGVDDSPDEQCSCGGDMHGVWLRITDNDGWLHGIMRLDNDDE